MHLLHSTRDVFLPVRIAHDIIEGEGALNPLTRVLPEALTKRIQQAKRNLMATSISSYSQEGEDLVLKSYFGDRSFGYYVDVGAHHPWRFSNTYLFYKRGWSGVNIDAAPGTMALFESWRPRDTNIEAAVTKDGRELTFHMFDEPAVNSMDESLSRDRDGGQQGFRKIGERKLKTRTLRDILTEHADPARRIDFLTVDVEGLDIEVLESNDWDRFRPGCVLAEYYGSHSFSECLQSDVGLYLGNLGFEPFAKTANTLFFRDMNGPK